MDDNSRELSSSDDSDNDRKGLDGLRNRDEDNDFEVYRIEDSSEDSVRYKARKTLVEAVGGKALDPKDIKLDLKERKGVRFQETSVKPSIVEEKVKRPHTNKYQLGNLDGAFVDINGIVELACTVEQKDQEKSERTLKMQDLDK